MRRKLSLLLPLAIATTCIARADNVPPAHYDGDWWQQVTRSIRASEYDFRQAGDGVVEYTAVNRSQNFAIAVTRQGIDVTARDAQNESWFVRLSLSRLEQFGANVTPAIAAVSAEERKLAFNRGDLRETLRNDESGLSLRIDIGNALPVDEASVLAFDIDTDLEIVFTAGASRVDFYQSGQRAASLIVRAETGGAGQATTVTMSGKALEVGAIVAAEAVQVVLSSVADTVAGPSPVADWILNEEQADSAFAFSVSPAGDVDGDGFSDVIIGAPDFNVGLPSRAGRALLYRGSADGLMTTPSWTADGPIDNARFGAAVASAGDFNDDGFFDVVIGAPAIDTATVFLGSASGLQAGALTMTGSGGGFGYAVAGAGDVNGDGFDDLVIGAPGDGSGGHADIRFGPDDSQAPALIVVPLENSCRIFTDSNCDQAAANAMFGHAVSSAGDVDGDGLSDVLIGAPNYQFSGDGGCPASTTGGSGGAFVYLGVSLINPGRQPDTADWCAEPGDSAGMLSGSRAGGQTGYSVAAAGDIDGNGYDDIVVGSPGWNYKLCQDCNTIINVGAALVYQACTAGSCPADVRDLFDLTWAAIGVLDDTDAVDTRFGASVAGADVNGDGIGDVVVGAPDQANGSVANGAAYLYLGSSTRYRGASDDAGLRYTESQVLIDVFGNSALTNNQVALRGTADWTTSGTARGGNLGRVVASGGDVNGDGFSDLLIGEFGRANAHAAFALAPHVTRYNNPVAGDAVAAAGDTDGDGYDDLLLINNGNIGLYYGSANGFPGANIALGMGNASRTVVGDIDGDGLTDVVIGRPPDGVDIYSGADPSVVWSIAAVAPGFGTVVAGAGDVNGDGYADVLIGDSSFDAGQGPVGKVWLFLGSAAGFAPGTGENDAAWFTEGAADGSAFGAAVAGAGDINADGYADVIVGSPGEGTGGRAHVYLGSLSTPLAALSWTSAGALQPGAEFGAAVAPAGDVNGDGFGDVIVGAPGTTLFGEPDVGRAFLYLGSAAGLDIVEAWTFDGLQEGDRFGQAMAGLGDLNADGRSDVAVANLAFFGATGGLSSTPAWPVDGTMAPVAVPAGGDVNGDGFGDIALAGENFISPIAVYLGNSVRSQSGHTAGVPRLLQQSNPGGGLIAPQGVAAGTSFDIRMQTPGRPGAYALEWEVKPMGLPFDGTGIERGSVNELMPGMAELSLVETVGALDSGTPYRWRARIVSDSVVAPHTPWFSISGSAAHVVTAGARAASPFASIAPAQNQQVFGDSAPVVFQWNSGDSAAFEIQWSGNDRFDQPAIASGNLAASGNDIETYTPDAQQWTDILSLANNPDFRDAPIFWRVMADGATASDTRALRLAAAAGPQLVSPADGQSAFIPPTITWDANHNERFQVQFSASGYLADPLVVVPADFGITGTSFTISATTWSEVEGLVPPGADGTGVVYFVVRGRDALGRTTISDIRSLRVNATGTAPPQPPKNKGGGGVTSPAWLLPAVTLMLVTRRRRKDGAPGRTRALM